MSEKALTKEIAEQFLAYPDEVSLYEFTSIEDEAAEILVDRGFAIQKRQGT